jgi:diguanylate cyclase (GGDEF)-like protein
LSDSHANTSWIYVSATAAMLLWSLLVAYSLYWNTTNLREGMVHLATTEARDYWNKDLAFRRWASRHGGVYVRPDERTPPNPNLSHLPQRDLKLADGTELTLMNPAYMLRQLSEEQEKEIGVRGKATGLLVLDAKNSPDAWERKVLQRFEQGETEVVEETAMDGQPFIRYMKVVMMERSCVKCHGVLGFKEGDVRGGVSVSIPLSTYFDGDKATRRSISVAHMIVWAFGLCGIMLFFAVVRARQVESQRLIRQIEYEALHDVLTGLPNRQLFLDRVAQSLARSQQEEGYHSAVCSVDLDRFKMINDSYGHQLGDRILQEIAQRLRRCVDAAHTVARLGGDEFNLLLEGKVTLESTLSVAERVLQAIREVIVIDGVEIHTSASIGICCTSTCYNQAQDMIRDADIAMNRAKDEGKGRIEFFNPMMHQKAVTILQLESELHEALARGELAVHYQPIVNSHNNTVGGFEALLRWHHPQLGDISPGEFIPVAEAVGLIGELGEWVLQQACQQVYRWNRDYDSQFFVSVNFSARQIADAAIVETVRHTLSESQLPPNLLHCEVTESTLMQHRKHVARVLDEIRQLGARISIDDFGTGYSSLTYLHQFCFDVLKIDKSFVQDMTAEGKGLQLVRMLMMLARDFNMEVIAEGVETEDQYLRLKAFKCTWIQGFYFLRPAPTEVIDVLLQKGYARNVEMLIDWDPLAQLSQA